MKIRAHSKVSKQQGTPWNPISEDLYQCLHLFEHVASSDPPKLFIIFRVLVLQKFPSFT